MHSIAATPTLDANRTADNSEIAASIGRYLIAISMLAFGIQHIVYADFVTRLVPKLPDWVSGQPFLAEAFGLFLIASGVMMMIASTARFAALNLGAVLFGSFALVYLPQAATTSFNGGLWTNAGKALTMSAAAFLVAGTRPSPPGNPSGFTSKAHTALDRFIPLAPFFLSAFLIFCGVEHFIYARFVVPLVPAWIPGPYFWTYFSGVALIAGGIGIAIPRTSRLASILSSVMVFLWVIMLHIPRAAADLHNSNETTAVFEAIAVAAVTMLVAVVRKSG